MSKPPGIDYGWVIVGAGALMTCVGFGTMLSLAVFLQPISEAMGWSRAGVSAAATLDFLCMGVAAFLWGTLSDRFGTRIVVLAGSLLLGLGLVTASQAAQLWQFQLCFGVLIGIAAGSFYAPMMALASAWIETNRSLAVALVSAGMGVAPMTMSPLAAWLVSHWDWRTSMQCIAAVVAAIMIPVSLLVRRPPEVERDTAAAPQHGPGLPEMTRPTALRSPQFTILLATNFFCCATHSGPIIHTVSYAVSCGIPLMAAVTIYSVEGLAGLFGRIAFGLLGDRFGAKRILVLGLLAQAFGALAYVFAQDLAAFYAVAAVFGFIYAGTMPLYAAIARENFPQAMMGTVMGGIAMAGSLGMATGPLAGGLIYDSFASYTWLYVGSWLMGLGAVLIMTMFKPFARTRPQAPPMPARASA